MIYYTTEEFVTYLYSLGFELDEDEGDDEDVDPYYIHRKVVSPAIFFSLQPLSQYDRIYTIIISWWFSKEIAMNILSVLDMHHNSEVKKLCIDRDIHIAINEQAYLLLLMKNEEFYDYVNIFKWKKK